MDIAQGLQVRSTLEFNIDLIFFFSLSTIHREYAALAALPYFDSFYSVLHASVSNPPMPSTKEAVKDAMEAHHVNEPQAAAILATMQARGFMLIQGYAAVLYFWSI